MRLATSLLCVVFAFPVLDAEPVRPAFGAIRWDAWMQGDTVTRAVEKSLSPGKYHFRVPFFGLRTPEGGVKFPAYTQEIFDREMAYASHAGVDYFAYCTYPTNDGLSLGLQFHRNSRWRQQVKMCLLMHHPLVKDWQEERRLLVATMKEPWYHRTPDGRPIVFALDSPIQKVKGRAVELRQQALAAGLKAPYLVWMNWKTPAEDCLLLREYGFDARSAYSHGPRGQESYTEYSSRIRASLWEGPADLGLEVVPYVSAGWDRRCRDENPVPWDRGIQAVSNADGNPFVRPRPEELAEHVHAALEWASVNRAIVPSQSIILYAWNEHDEGGWLCPTWGPASPGAPGFATNTDRIEAIRNMLAVFPASVRAPYVPLPATERLPREGLALWLDASNPNGRSGELPMDLSTFKQQVVPSGRVRMVRFEGGRAAWRLEEGACLDVPKLETEEALSVFVVAQCRDNGSEPLGRLASAMVSKVDWKAPSWCLHLGGDVSTQKPRIAVRTLIGVYTRGLRLGKEMGTGNSRFVGDIAEVLVYGRLLKGPEQVFIQQYLEKKWTSSGGWTETPK